MEETVSTKKRVRVSKKSDDLFVQNPQPFLGKNEYHILDPIIEQWECHERS